MDYKAPQPKQPNKQPTRPPEPPKPLYAAAEPYPEIQVEGMNLHYAQILKTSLASSKSEISSITQYLFQSWVLAPEFAELSKTMRHIAKVEMHHMDILGQLITMLGGAPSFSCIQHNRQIPWNGGMVFYSRMVRQILQNNIMAEQDAIRQYNRQIQAIQDHCIKQILARIILDEEIHIQIYKKYL